MAPADAVRVATRDLSLARSVRRELAGEGLDRRPRSVDRTDLRREDQRPDLRAHPMVQLVVLVARKGLVIATCGEDRRAPKRGLACGVKHGRASGRERRVE